MEARLQEGWMQWVIEFVDIGWFAETQAKAIKYDGLKYMDQWKIGLKTYSLMSLTFHGR